MSGFPLELTGLLPLWIVLGGVLVLLSLEMFWKKEGRKAAPLLTGAVLFMALASVFHLLAGPMPGALFQGTVVVDLFSLTMEGICVLSAILGCVFSASYLVREKAVTGEFYALLLLCLSGMFVLVLASEFITLFVGLELMSLTAYVLTGYFRVRERAVEAALKYFIMGVFASAFLLYGIAVLYGASGSTHFLELRHFLEQKGTASFAVEWGAALLIVGFGFKGALVPFHGWAPDVYDGAPASVTAFLSTGVKAAGFAAFTRVFTEAFGLSGGWSQALAILAVLTMTLGNLGALAQKSVKRMLAYSSVAHAGYIAVGLSVVAWAPANEVDRAVAFYLLAYTLMTAGAFGWLSWAGREGEAGSPEAGCRGLGLKHPWMGLAMAVFLFSLAGMTPTAGFFGKYYLFKLAVDHGMTGLALIAVLNSFVSAFYYLRTAVSLYQMPESEIKPIPVTLGLGFAFFLCMIGSLAVGFLKFPF